MENNQRILKQVKSNELTSILVSFKRIRLGNRSEQEIFGTTLIEALIVTRVKGNELYSYPVLLHESGKLYNACVRKKCRRFAPAEKLRTVTNLFNRFKYLK